MIATTWPTRSPPRAERVAATGPGHRAGFFAPLWVEVSAPGQGICELSEIGERRGVHVRSMPCPKWPLCIAWAFHEENRAEDGRE